MNAVIMWLDDSRLISIYEANYMLPRNRRAEQPINVWLSSVHLSLHYHCRYSRLVFTGCLR